MGQNEFHYAYSEGNLAALMLVLQGKSQLKAAEQLGITQGAISRKLKLMNGAGMPTWLIASEYVCGLSGGKLEFSSLQTVYRQKMLEIITSMAELQLPSTNQQLILRHIVNPPEGGKAKKFSGNATLIFGCFVKIVECQGFPKAAENLNITQSAVSINIRLLRNVIGDPLVLTRKGIAYLTAPIGQQAYDIAFKYFARLNKLQKLIEKINADPALCAANNELQNAPATAEATRG